MKDSKHYGKLIDKFFAEMRKKHGKVAEKSSHNKPVEALVFAIISRHLDLAGAAEILNKIKEHFVDFNDLRVCRKEELLEILGDKLPEDQARQTIAEVHSVLNAVFEKYDSVNLEELSEMGKRDARKVLEELGNISTFAAGYCFMTALEGHSVPLTPRMAAYLHDSGLVNPESDESDINGFLERHISAKDGFEFYQLLRMEVESGDMKIAQAIVKKSSGKPQKDEAEKPAGPQKSDTGKKTKKKTAVKKKAAAKKKTKTKKKVKTKTKPNTVKKTQAKKKTKKK